MVFWVYFILNNEKFQLKKNSKKFLGILRTRVSKS